MAAEERSMQNAKDATTNFAKEKQEPLASSKSGQSKPGITFAAQEKLPKLPIPDLEASMKKYLIAVDPLQSAREHHDTERAVSEFLKSDGPELQEKLKGYAQGKSSYIEQFCRCPGFESRRCVILTIVQGMTLTLTTITRWYST